MMLEFVDVGIDDVGKIFICVITLPKTMFIFKVSRCVNNDCR